MARTSGVFRRIIQLIVDAKTVQRTKLALQDALNKGTDAKGVRQNLKNIDRALAGLKSTAVGLGASLLAVFGGRKLIEYADTWKLIQGRLKLVTEGSAALKQVQQDLLGIANRTRSSFEGTAALFTRISMNADQLGRSQQELLDLTETVQKSIQIGGQNATEAHAGVIQLSQALASGVLRGDEFRSVMENLPGLARTLADGLGVPIGKLREMAFAGELTADTVVGAILRMKNSVDEDFKSVPITIGGAFQVLGNEIMEFVGTADEGTEASSAFADTILAIAQAADMASAALRKLNESRTQGRSLSDPTRAGAAVSLDLTPEEIARLRQRGVADDIRQQRGLQMGRPASATPDAVGPFLARLTSERTGQLVAVKAAGEATQKEIEELNALYAEGNKLLKEGNLSLQERFDITKGLADLGIDEAAKKAAEEMLKLEDEHIRLLLEAHELGIATKEEDAELVRIQERFTAMLADGDLALAERVRIAEHLKKINEALEGRGMFRRAPTQADLLLGQAVPSLFGFPKDSSGEDVIRAPNLRLGPTTEEQREQVQQWLDAHAEMQSAAENAAFGVANAWSEALGMIRKEGEGLPGFFEAIFRGSAGAALGALAQLAASKVAEHVARAFSEKALAASAAANPALWATVPLHLAAMKTHYLAAAKWAVFGGTASAAQGAVAGGGAGGQSGGIPSGARDSVARMADRIPAMQTITIINNIDGIDPKNGRHQELVGNAQINFTQRRGSRITSTRK